MAARDLQLSALPRMCGVEERKKYIKLFLLEALIPSVCSLRRRSSEAHKQRLLYGDTALSSPCLRILAVNI